MLKQNGKIKLNYQCVTNEPLTAETSGNGELKYPCSKLDKEAIKQSMAAHLGHTLVKSLEQVTHRDWYEILSHAIRDRIAERWVETIKRNSQQQRKRVYYLSLEFLTGRLLSNNLLNLNAYDVCVEVLTDLGLNAEKIIERMENDPALGNGGLGRLAACFLDSMATLDIAGYGYGIHYEFGMFYQRLHQGWQVEQPDNWLRYNNPWELPRAEFLYKIKFGGTVLVHQNAQGHSHYHWQSEQHVMAMAYDMPVVGYQNNVVNTLRLWAAKSSRGLELSHFNHGEYWQAVADKNRSENLSKVLYPDDSTEKGRELRFRQEYFFVSASIQDILRRHQDYYSDICHLVDKVAIHLNDTHPALAIPEMMRLLLDHFNQSWDSAWDITRHIFSYTNHTLLPEALETWPITLFERLLPRHLQLIYEINRRLLLQVENRYPHDLDKQIRLSLIGETPYKHVRMAHLSVVGSRKVNGVAKLHTDLMKSQAFADLHQFYPDKITHKTNGISPRRWLNEANPALAQLLKQTIGDGWLTDLSQLKQIEPLAKDSEFIKKFQQVKQHNKQRLLAYIKHQLQLSINLNPHSLFDVQVKRIHEYKRQWLNVLHVIHCYNKIRQHPHENSVARTVIFAGKAAPAYHRAKLIIKLINNVADIVNHDPLIGDKLKVLFIPNYGVSLACKIIPAADLSEQISTAGMEASGTGNMKLALNGALTIGTLDGANIEIRDQVGKDNIFIFGNTNNQLETLRGHYQPWDYYLQNPDLRQVLDLLNSNHFCQQEPALFQPLFKALLDQGDEYFLLADFADYIQCQQRVSHTFANPAQWTEKAIINVANMGWFSSDRTIQDYANDCWQLPYVVK